MEEVLRGLTDEQAQVILNELFLTDRTEHYKTSIVDFAVEVLGFRRNSFEWSSARNPDGSLPYENHKWDSSIVHAASETSVADPLLALFGALERSRPRFVAVESALSVGKTLCAAIVILWFVACFPRARVAILGPKLEHIKDNLWREVRILFPRFKARYPNAKIGTCSLVLDTGNEYGNKADVRIAKGFTAGKSATEKESASAAQGFHEEHMLIVVDETPGVHPANLNAFINTSTGMHNMILMLGNPNARYDELHKFAILAHTVHFRFSAFDHPNVVMDWEFIPGCVTQNSLQILLERCGNDPKNAFYLSRARGICPTTGEDALFTAAVLDRCETFVRVPVKEHVHHRLKPVDAEGFTRIYYEAQKGYINRYIMFCDLSGNTPSGDWSAGVMYDRLERHPVAVIHMRGDMEQFAEEVVLVCNQYVVPMRQSTYLDTSTDTLRQKDNWYFPMLAWERSNLPSFELIDAIKTYPNLAVNLELVAKGEKHGRVYGWHTNRQTRPDLQARLRELNATLFHMPELIVAQELLDEYKTFVRDEEKSQGDYLHYAAAEGCNDDLVMAMAGALQFDRMYSEYPPVPVPSEDAATKIVQPKSNKFGWQANFKRLGTRRSFA